MAAPLPPRPNCDHGDDGGFTCGDGLCVPPDEERPGSRRGFVPMESSKGEGDTDDENCITDVKEVQQRCATFFDHLILTKCPGDQI